MIQVQLKTIGDDQITITFGNSSKKLKEYRCIGSNSGEEVIFKLNTDNILKEITVNKASQLLPFINVTPQKVQESIHIKYDKWANSAYIYLVKIKPGESAKTHPFDPYEINAEINLDFNKK